MDKKRNIAILGSTGSVGTQALQVIDIHPELFNVTALIANTGAEKLLAQIRKYKPRFAGLVDEKAAGKIKNAIPTGTTFASGEQCLIDACAIENTDIVLIAVVGTAGIKPLFECIKRKKQIALANKEAIVCGGSLAAEALKNNAQVILPVDSEHSAIFQALHAKGEGPSLKRILLTCSGGAFLSWNIEQLRNAIPEQALRHPNWNMGRKVTIDSASLMNKGLEVIEARWLFDTIPDKIEVVIHQQSIIHSMVEYEDNSIIAQMGLPDMRVPIQYALSYPRRAYAGVDAVDFTKVGCLTFEKPDIIRFPCLALAYEALKMGKSASIALNAANDVAVELFFNKQIGFMDIPEIIEKGIAKFGSISIGSVHDILDTDKACREYILKENS